MINTKPTGPAVCVRMFYGTDAVYELTATDDARELEGKVGAAFAVAICEQIVALESGAKVRAVKREAA